MIIKTTISLTVLHDAEDMRTLCGKSLSYIAEQMDSGAFIGRSQVCHAEKVKKGKLREELVAVGNDGTFFV